MQKTLLILLFLPTLLHADNNVGDIDGFLKEFSANEINHNISSKIYNSSYSGQTLQTIEMNDRFDELYDQQQKLILMEQQRAENDKHRLETERINNMRYNGYNAAYPIMRKGIDDKKSWKKYKQPKAQPIRSVTPAPY